MEHGKPEEGSNAPVDRTVASSLGARADLALDALDDLRMAVSEACAVVLPAADEGADLLVEFGVGAGSVRARLSVPAAAPARADRDSWAWQVLSALTDECWAGASDGRFTVSLTVGSAVPGA